MKPTLQHIALMEALGWTQVGPVKTSDGIWGYPKAGVFMPSLIPPLTLDLMHEAEETLTKEQRIEYGSYLWDATEGRAEGGFRLIHADKEARLEAFLRTIGRFST